MSLIHPETKQERLLRHIRAMLFPVAVLAWLGIAGFLLTFAGCAAMFGR